MLADLRPEDPRSVGGYRLLARLSGGGMGQVYVGRSPGGRQVAVKLLHPALADAPGFRKRFALEVAAARKVGGFHTAQVVDADPDADPPWLVTAYIPGPSLGEAVETYGPLPAAAVEALGAGLAEGLAAIHASGLVHRDLKPGNVILGADGPRVIDFGIARALDATSTLTAAGAIGTPAFMSPEQSRGEEVGPAGDVFCLGAVLAYAATGRAPFGGGAAEAVMFRIRHDPPDLSGLSGISGLSGRLGELIGDCLAKDPAARPAIGDILAALTATASDVTTWLPAEIHTMITEHAGDTRVLAPGGERVPPARSDTVRPSGTARLSDTALSDTARAGVALGGGHIAAHRTNPDSVTFKVNWPARLFFSSLVPAGLLAFAWLMMVLAYGEGAFSWEKVFDILDGVAPVFVLATFGPAALLTVLSALRTADTLTVDSDGITVTRRSRWLTRSMTLVAPWAALERVRLAKVRPPATKAVPHPSEQGPHRLILHFREGYQPTATWSARYRIERAKDGGYPVCDLPRRDHWNLKRHLTLVRAALTDLGGDTYTR